MTVYGNSSESSGVVGTVTVVFLFCGVYSVVWTPLATVYPPEVLNYSCRAIGMAAFSFAAWSSVVFVSFVFPFAIENIGWKFYMINAGWDVLQVRLPWTKLSQAIIIFAFYEETSHNTLEGIDEIFEGIKHSGVQGNVYDMFRGKIRPVSNS